MATSTGIKGFQMKKFLVLMAAGFALTAQASGRTVILCESVPFSDIAKIEVKETDVAGQYQIVETHLIGRNQSPKQVVSSTFGMDEIEKSEFPNLSSWFGYSRKLIRFGRDNYSLEHRDECGGAVSSLQCKETF